MLDIIETILASIATLVIGLYVGDEYGKGYVLPAAVLCYFVITAIHVLLDIAFDDDDDDKPNNKPTKTKPA